MRSDRIKKGVERAPHRALMFATGITRAELDKPMIGVATSFTDLIPGHIGMRDLERFIEKGVHAGGGWPLFFGLPGICDGIAMGHRGMHYSLPSRELIADMVESVATAHAFDGLMVFQLNGEAAGQTVFHYHMHLMPRTRGEPLQLHTRVPGDPARPQSPADAWRRERADAGVVHDTLRTLAPGEVDPRTV